MKKFLIKIFIFSLPLIAIFFTVSYLFDGYSDPFYIRFTTPKQKNLIIGTSRAAQGLQPEIFKNKLNCNFFNYAFTIAHSPFGKVYLESIQKKHSKQANGKFIIAVDPWSISSWCKSPNDLEQFRENILCLNHIENVNLYPNIFYISSNFSTLLSNLFIGQNSNMFLHEDGWLEIKNIAMDSISVADRISKKIDTYKNNHLPKTKFSKIRLDYLIKLIEYLKTYGDVYLVRLPIAKSMMVIENKLMPNFDNVIAKAIEMSDGYLDLTPKNDLFLYTDGNHLHKESGKIVSNLVAEWIAQ